MNFEEAIAAGKYCRRKSWKDCEKTYSTLFFIRGDIALTMADLVATDWECSQSEFAPNGDK